MSGPHPDLEFYETPEAHTRWLFGHVGIVGTVFDPCAGSGAIRRAAEGVYPLTAPSQQRTWIEADIDPHWRRPGLEQWDATSPIVWEGMRRRIDWVVTNTPFSKLIEIADLALEAVRHSGGVALHARISINEPLETGPRRTWMHRHTPHRIMFLPRFAYQRSPKTGAYMTDSAACCWLVWYRDSLKPYRLHYAPEDVIAAAHAERAAYRARMDALMGYTGSEADRRAARIARATQAKGVATT